jgi:adenylyltransferase/sulfurtransferase
MLDLLDRRLARTLGRERLERLHASRVALVGVGLLGGQLAHHLAMLQIPTILVDPGRVDEENLGNQWVPAAALGEAKVALRARQMRALNPSCPVRAIEARVEDVGLGVFADVGLLLTGLDSPAGRLVVNRIAARLGVDWIDAAVDGSGERSYGTVSWLRPGSAELACYGCRWDADSLAALARRARREPCASWRRPGASDAAPTLTASPFGAIVAGFQLSWALQALAGEGDGDGDGGGRVGAQLQVSASGEPRLRRVTLARRPGCASPHGPLPDLRRIDGRGVGELLERASADLGGAPTALVLPDRPMAFGLACAGCGTRRDLVRRCEAISDDDVRCGCGAEMAPRGIGTRIEGRALADVADRSFESLGVPAEDLVVVERSDRRAYYLLPADAGPEGRT